MKKGNAVEGNAVKIASLTFFVYALLSSVVLAFYGSSDISRVAGWPLALALGISVAASVANYFVTKNGGLAARVLFAALNPLTTFLLTIAIVILDKEYRLTYSTLAFILGSYAIVWIVPQLLPNAAHRVLAAMKSPKSKAARYWVGFIVALGTLGGIGASALGRLVSSIPGNVGAIIFAWLLVSFALLFQFFFVMSARLTKKELKGMGGKGEAGGIG